MTTSTKPRLPGNRDAFAAFVCDEGAIETLRPLAVELGFRTEACRKGGMRSALQTLSVSASPAILLVDLAECADPLSDIDSLAEVCEPGTIVIAIGSVNDVGLYRELVARGVHDYLPKPLSASPLRDALARAEAILAAPRDANGDGEDSHVAAAVIGVRGGVGASMLATSLAWLLSTEHAKSTALLDLDVHFGTGALTLDLEPGRGLTDAIENPARIDGLFIDRAIVRANDRLAIMSAEAPLNMPLLTDGSAFFQLEEEFRNSYQATVIDLPRSIMMNFPHLLTELNVVVVVADLTLASARDALRILSWLRINAPGAQVLLVANKVQAGSAEISEADFKTAVEHDIDFAVPYDHPGAINAARLGQTFAEANRSAKSVVPIRQIARAVAEPGLETSAASDQPARPASLLGRFDFAALLPRKGKAAAQAPAARP